MSAPASQRLILVDGSSFLFRAYHALPPLSSPQGLPTNAIHGVSNMLRKLLADYEDCLVIVVFDAPGKTFRNELYADYKANRPAMPEDLAIQIEPLHQLIRAMGLPLLMESGVEADDLIGLLARKAEQAGREVIISTGDKDMAQLVSSKITLENSMSNSRMDRQGVIDKFGVAPEQIVDYPALMGDSIDNIPGVPNVGPKTAAKWLNKYHTLENLLVHADEITGKVGESLRASLAQLPLAKELATIRCDLNLPYSLADLQTQPVNQTELIQLLTHLGFSTWLKALLKNPSKSVEISDTPSSNSIIEPVYETVLTYEHLQTWLNKLETSQLISFDTETTSLDYCQAEIVGLSFAVEPAHAAYLPLRHLYPGVLEQLDRDKVLQLFKPLLEDSQRPKVGQHLKYDAHVLANHGITLQGIAHDTMLQSYVLNSVATKHNMDDIARTYLGIQTITYEDVAGKGSKQIPFQEVDIERATTYSAEDADITLRLHQTLFPRLQELPNLLQLYQSVEMPLVAVLTRMESNGVLIDSAMLAQQSLELTSQITAVELQSHKLAGRSFNIGSPKQIQEILYDQLKLPVLKKTPTGQPSTEESVLQDLAVDYELPKLILEYRSLSKLKSTYTDKLPQQINAKTGRVHTSYHQAVTATGRLSSTDPNLQNIPIRTEAGRKIRQAFIAPPGYRIVAADYSQIELRIMAHLSNDPGLLTAFNTGADVHRATAAEVFSVTLEQVTAELRRSAKAINFGLIYGMSAFGLAQQLGLSRSQAQSYIDLYFARYPGVKDYMDNIREQARQQGYVETLFGRRLYLPDILSKNASLRQYAERTAINAPMQGTAADIIKLAMLATDDWLQTQKADAKLIMQVHDELVFEVAEEKADPYRSKIAELMASAANLNVPLVVDTGVGFNWDEAH